MALCFFWLKNEICLKNYNPIYITGISVITVLVPQKRQMAFKPVLRFSHLSRRTAVAAFPCYADWPVLKYRLVP